MERVSGSVPKRPRFSIDIDPDLRRRLRLAAARRDLSVRQYVLEAVEQRLHQDVPADPVEAPGLTAATDPVLAELWGNERDAAYDRL